MIIESLWAIAPFLWREEVGIREENRDVREQMRSRTALTSTVCGGC